jgi:hypothetical protein
MQTGQDGLSHRLEALIEKLPEEKRTPLRELLLSLLEPTQKLQAHRDSLERLEEKYLLALKEDERDQNVVNFRRVEIPETVPKPQRRWRLKSPCLIEAATYGELFRMAFELHLRSARSIFLSWHDIDPGSRQKPEVILELVSCTIFIPDITRVSIFEQQSLLNVLRTKAEEKPMLMAGTHAPFSDLQTLAMLDKEFLSEISQAYLKLTKPVAQYKREGLIRYFLESLS